MLIDIHSHQNHRLKNNELCFMVGRHSLGIHPYELVPPYDLAVYRRKFELLKIKVDQEKMAIGECGLDRRRKNIAPIEIQREVFSWHLAFAQQLNFPLIVHNVAASSDLLDVFKKEKFKGKILFHDFSNNQEIAKEFLAYDSYFSFGKKIFIENSKSFFAIKFLPLERIFLETDDQNDFMIEALYQQAANLLGLEFRHLEQVIENNLALFFSDLHHLSPAQVVSYLSNPGMV